MPGLFPATEYPREPYTLERAIVMLIYAKRLVPKAGDSEWNVMNTHPGVTNLIAVMTR